MNSTFFEKVLVTSLGFTVGVLLALALPIAVSAEKPSYAAASKPGDMNIAEVAISNGNFTTLVTALSCTDLVPAVTSGKQLTVFAPTDAAFAGIGLNADNVCDVEGLKGILLYHVINGRQTSSSVLARSSYRTLSGERLTRAEVANGLLAPNVSASNGVIHVMNTVLLPN